MVASILPASTRNCPACSGAEAGKTPVVVGHFDHFGEISEDTVACIRRLRVEGVRFLNQAVLLAGVLTPRRGRTGDMHPRGRKVLGYSW
jgi:hypothetical protein